MTDSPPPARPDARPGLPIGRPFGIPVFVSPSWFLVAALITMLFEEQARTVAARPASFAVAFAFAVLLYASVFVHELSHAVTARVFGMPVRSVTLHVLGGETVIDRESPTPGREFLIAFAGPLVNIVLGGAGLAVLWAVPLPPAPELLLRALTVANLLVGVFNLLPGLPLDGGRLIRATVWKITGRGRDGTMVAGWVGRGVAAATIMAGAWLAAAQPAGDALFTMLWSALVAAFIWVGATRAMQAERVRSRIPLLDARRLARRAALVPTGTPLAEALRRAREASAGAVVVVDHDGAPTGLVSEQAVLAVPEQRRPWIDVAEVARTLRPGLTIPADISGEPLLESLRRDPATEYLLTEADGSVYGVLAAADLDRVFAGV